MPRYARHFLDDEHALGRHAMPLRDCLRRNGDTFVAQELCKPNGPDLLFQILERSAFSHAFIVSTTYAPLQAKISSLETLPFGKMPNMKKGTPSGTETRGDRIRYIRERLRVTQEGFAEWLSEGREIALTRGAVANWERNEGITRDNLDLIGEKTGISGDWISKGTGPSPFVKPLRQRFEIEPPISPAAEEIDFNGVDWRLFYQSLLGTLQDRKIADAEVLLRTLLIAAKAGRFRQSDDH